MSAPIHAIAPPATSHLGQLPLATLYLTDRCNSRCVTCDYWRHGRNDMSLSSVERLLPSFRRLRTQMVLVSGGEPLLNPAWAPIAQLLRQHGLKVWLLTSGLSLAKHARRASQLFDAITVSLDGTDRATYLAIRGVDAFDKVCQGIEAAALGVAPSIRVTVQRANFRQLPRFVSLAQELGAREISFLAVDVANPHAFARTGACSDDLALRTDDLHDFAQLLYSLEQEFTAQFASGFIAETPEKLRRMHQYFSALRGRAPFPGVRCNAPQFSAVVGADGRIQPCFFIAGPNDAVDGGLDVLLNGDAMRALRDSIRNGERAECKTCVCSMWRPIA